MKIGTTYEDFFSSLGDALITCTLLVSIGKLITYYYFLHIIICSLLIVGSLMIYDYKYKAEKSKLRKAGEEQYSSASKLVTSKKKNFKNKLDAAMSIDSYSRSIEKELNVRKRSWIYKEGQQSLNKGDINRKHSPIKKQQSCPPDVNDSHKRDGKPSKKFLMTKEKVPNLLIKEVQRSSTSEKSGEINKVFTKGGQIYTLEEGIETMV